MPDEKESKRNSKYAHAEVLSQHETCAGHTTAAARKCIINPLGTLHTYHLFVCDTYNYLQHILKRQM
jgi:hypothetical protein